MTMPLACWASFAQVCSLQTFTIIPVDNALCLNSSISQKEPEDDEAYPNERTHNNPISPLLR